MDFPAGVGYKAVMPLRPLLLTVAIVACAAPARAQLITSDHPGQYTQEEIAAGNRVYTAQCNFCHGRDGDQVSGIDLRRGIFRRALGDEDLARVITTGTPAGMPGIKLSPPELTGIVAFIRAGFDATASVRVGDATRGKALFEGKGTCATCHRVGGRGPRVAPALGDIGLVRSPAQLDRSIRNPTSAMLPINRPVRVVMKSGATIRGRRLNEDTATVQLIDEGEQLRSIDKRDIRTLEVETTSPMPAFAGRLTDNEIGDLVGYLRTLRER
jgi:putative heme-binding domain-containing protein